MFKPLKTARLLHLEKDSGKMGVPLLRRRLFVAGKIPMKILLESFLFGKIHENPITSLFSMKSPLLFGSHENFTGFVQETQPEVAIAKLREAHAKLIQPVTVRSQYGQC